ncbi:GSCOCG00012072001-RA-CDS [Cotesia congregata]|nr:GSCOCG00012072001-RA-CDS [Cotesia congregata]
MLRRHLSPGSSRDSGFTSLNILYFSVIDPRNINSDYLILSRRLKFSLKKIFFLEMNVFIISSIDRQIRFNINKTVLRSSTKTPLNFHPNSQETAAGYKRQPSKGQTSDERPHTISSAYEKAGHKRPALSVYTFQTPDSTGMSQL